MLPAREFNRRLERAIKALRSAGAQRIRVEIQPDGGARVVEAGADASDEDEGARIGRLIEDRLGNA